MLSLSSLLRSLCHSSFTLRCICSALTAALSPQLAMLLIAVHGDAAALDMPHGARASIYGCHCGSDCCLSLSQLTHTRVNQRMRLPWSSNRRIRRRRRRERRKSSRCCVNVDAACLLLYACVCVSVQVKACECPYVSVYVQTHAVINFI